MTLAEVIPLIDSLPRSDKFELMRFILSKLSKDECLPSEAKPAAAAKKKDALWDIVGMADGEDADVARNHDKHLYGAESVCSAADLTKVGVLRTAHLLC